MPQVTRAGAHRRARPRQWLAVLLSGWGLAIAAVPVRAEPRGETPPPLHRQIGGTQGPCGRRLLVHLVPEQSRMALGESRIVGLVEEATSDPLPLQVSFQAAAGSAQSGSSLLRVQGEAAVTLLQLPDSLVLPLLWRSRYGCDELLGVAYPEATTLLQPGPEADEPRTEALLRDLWPLCGGVTSRRRLVEGFRLSEWTRDRLPPVLPLRCQSLRAGDAGIAGNEDLSPKASWNGLP